MDRVHLLKAQTVRREVGAEHEFDPRIIVAGCRLHHGMFDFTRAIRVPRGMLPPSVEEFAAEHGVEWMVERSYGGGPWDVAA